MNRIFCVRTIRSKLAELEARSAQAVVDVPTALIPQAANMPARREYDVKGRTNPTDTYVRNDRM
jgi:hypothetical protein